MSQPLDVIVVGLGAMGSSAIYQLARRGARVLGIDRFSPPHTMGSTHGDTRITRQAIGEGEQYVSLALRSYELWREIERESGEDLLTITGGLTLREPDSGAVQHGNPDFFRTVIRTAEQYGIQHELLSSADIRRRFPQFRPQGGEVGYYEAMTGFLRPERCVHAQLSLADKSGATLLRNQPVVAYESGHGGRGVRLRTEDAEYEAERLIITAGPWLPEVIGGEFASLFQVSRQVLYWFAVRSNAAGFTVGNFPIFMWELGDGSGRFMYGFPAIDGPEGGVKVATETMDAVTSPDLADRQVSPREIETFYREYVAKTLPDLGPECVKAVTCLYTTTPDAGFVIDFLPGQPDVVVASPCSGHGFKHSAAIGEVLADVALGGEPSLNISAFSFNRFHAEAR